MRKIDIEFTQEDADAINEIARETGIDKHPGYKPSKPSVKRCLFG